MAHVPPEAAQSITRQMARFARYVDTKQWPNFESLSLPTATYSFHGTDGKVLFLGPRPLAFDSAASASAYFDKFFADMDTMHNIGLGDLSQTGPDEVSAIFSFDDQLVSKAMGSWVGIRGGGYYYTTWKEVGGEWFLKDLRMERQYQERTLLLRVRLALAAWFEGSAG